jgi:uncharacterized protein (DUF2267 family)
LSHLFDDEYGDAWRYESFVTTIQQKAGNSWAEAEQAGALEAVLETLAERISGGDADDVAAYPPDDLHPPLERDRDRRQGAADVARRVRGPRRRMRGRLGRAGARPRPVLTTLREVIPDTEWSDLLAELPRARAGALT